MKQMCGRSSILCVILTLIGCINGQANEQSRTAIEYVEKVRNSPCTGGTEETLPVDFDHSVWHEYAEVAVRMANILTKSIIRSSGKLRVTEQYLFDLVRNNVDSNSLIFGSAIAVEEYVFPAYKTFCPYAYKKDRVYAHDISLNYNYLDPSTEWYAVLRNKDWRTADITVNLVTYRLNNTHHAQPRDEIQPMARQTDGHWTRPYYDCGGGDIWMVTYSAPIFDLSGSSPIFRGIGTIDIELTNIDINQCDADTGVGGENSFDVFRGTHNCPSTTKCVPVSGLGFIPGAYNCECEDGYYFPDAMAKVKSYNGTVVEKFISENGGINGTDMSGFTCLQCAPGCDTCVDDSPCLYSFNFFVRILLCVLGAVCFLAMIAASGFVHAYRERRVIKSASPIFLHIMNAGAALMCMMMFITFIEPDELGIVCIVKNWPRHIGFALAYGALLIKTWRISAIFKVKSAKKLNLSDKVLVQRFLPIPAAVTAYLVAWTAIGLPKPNTRKTNNDLKFQNCDLGYWDLGALVGEVCFLLWGAVLCYIVRKAPSLFNESKYITWAIYNNILLGSFILIIRELITINYGPDILYIMDFVYIQITVTGMMCLLYIPKILAVKRGEEEQSSVTGRQVTNATVSIDITNLGKDIGVNKICQTEIAGILLNLVAERTQGSSPHFKNNKVGVDPNSTTDA